MPKILFHLCRFVAAIIMLQTLYFKFSAHPDSVHIFTAIGMEPWGRYGTGIMELIAAIVLLFPRISWVGAVLGMGLMVGAIFFHLAFLGIVVNGDGGLLFGMAIITFVCCLYIAFFQKEKIINQLNRLILTTLS